MHKYKHVHQNVETISDWWRNHNQIRRCPSQRLRTGMVFQNFIFLKIWVRKIQSFLSFLLNTPSFFCWIVCQFVITDKEKVLGPIRTRQLLILVLYTKNASALNVTSWSDKIQNTTYTNEFIERPKLRACATKMISLSSYALISDTTPAAQKCTWIQHTFPISIDCLRQIEKDRLSKR